MRGKSEYTYECKWAADPPLENREKADPNEKFIKIGKIGKYDLSKYKVSKQGNIINKKNQLIKGSLEDGYRQMHLYCSKIKKIINISAHRIVAYKFISNDDSDNKIEVNHIDKNRSHNHYLNLEWVTHQENMIHALGKMVKMIDPNTNKVLKIFKTINDARRYLESSGKSNISDVCNGIRKICKGYKWEWVKENEILNMPVITIPITNDKTKMKEMMKKLNSEKIVEV